MYNMDAKRRPGAGIRPPPVETHFTNPEKARAPSLALPSAEQVYHDYAPRVYRMARRMVRSDVDAEDVTQDVLLQVVRKLPSFRGESALPTWLHRITVNAALSHRRKRAVREERRARTLVDHLREQEGGIRPEEQLLGRETRQLIERAIASLPPTYRTVLVLADVEGLPNAAIGERLGLSLPAAKSRLHRARLLMRDALAPHFESGVSCG
jgi:RNA polymerase sigma-70 factor (ECF subfamily)